MNLRCGCEYCADLAYGDGGPLADAEDGLCSQCREGHDHGWSHWFDNAHRLLPPGIAVQFADIEEHRVRGRVRSIGGSG